MAKYGKKLRASARCMALVRLTAAAVARRNLQCGRKLLHAGQDDLLYCGVHEGGHGVALLQLGIRKRLYLLDLFLELQVERQRHFDREALERTAPVIGEKLVDTIEHLLLLALSCARLLAMIGEEGEGQIFVSSSPHHRQSITHKKPRQIRESQASRVISTWTCVCTYGYSLRSFSCGSPPKENPPHQTGCEGFRRG
jgi:hypothetical protein